jgi:hypothetical protein
MCTLSWWISVDTVAVGLSFESLYSGPTHLLGARPRFLRSSLERLAIAVGCSWWLFRDTAGAWWSLGKWCVLGRCKIGRSYTINEWICGMQRGGSVRGTDKSKDLSLSGGCLTRRRIHARDRTVLDFARGIATVGPGIGTNLVQSASSSGGVIILPHLSQGCLCHGRRYPLRRFYYVRTVDIGQYPIRRLIFTTF